MKKLNEALAVLPASEKARKTVWAETEKIFSTRRELFAGSIKTYTAVKEGDPEDGTQEAVELTTTVSERLNYAMKPFMRSIDLVAAIETANQNAAASIRLGEEELTGLPVALLLNLEHRIKELRNIIEKCPTLTAGHKWTVDDNHAKRHVYRDQTPNVRLRTKKTLKPVIMHPATKEHPAQIEKTFEDVATGVFNIESWSGALSSARKAEILDRLTHLQSEVLQARQAANNRKVNPVHIGEAISRYILGDLYEKDKSNESADPETGSRSEYAY